MNYQILIYSSDFATIRPQTSTIPHLFFLLSILLHLASSLSQTLTLTISNSELSPAGNATIAPTPTGSGISSRRNYIVRFLEYKHATDHLLYLRQNSGFDGWDWIHRNNPASAYPTDFGLLSIDESATDAVIGEIERLELVKDVSVDMSYARGLFEDKPVGSNSGDAFCDGKKRPGKLFTRMSFQEEGREPDSSFLASNETISWGRHLMAQRSQVTSLFGADVLWAKGYTGAKVRMAIFDTGVRANHPHFRNIKERTNWTNENTLYDNLGHGTFVAGVIAGQDSDCPGFAPDTEIYAFRVFTDAQLIAGIVYIVVS